MDDLETQAIKLSLEGKWEEAAKANLAIIKVSPENIPAISRLAKAQLELGKNKEAISSYNLVIRLDPLNTIAEKNLSRLKSGTSLAKKSGSNFTNSPSIFLEEPGKTKTVPLVKLASADVLNRLDPGDTILLNPRQHSIAAVTPDGQVVGRLSDDVSARLIPLLAGGNTYSAVVRSVSSKTVKILIREEKRGKKYAHTPSFPITDHQSYVAHVPPGLVEDDETESSHETEEDQST